MDSNTSPEILRTASEWGRHVAGQRKVKHLSCLQCGRPFTTKGRGRYCSDRCRQAYYVAGQRAKRESENSSEISTRI